MGPDWLKNNSNQREPIILELFTGQTQRNKMVPASGRFEENKNKFDSYKVLQN